MAIAEEWAEFITPLEYQDLPREVVNKAKEVTLDTLGVALAAFSESSTYSIYKAALSWGSGNIAIWGFKESVSILGAALVNGTNAHALDYDDTHTGGIVHGSACIIPAALAAAEMNNKSGRELITAIVAGWDLAARIGLAAPGKFHAQGFHTTSVAGIFGATLAAGKLFALTKDQMVNALGLSGSTVSGVNEYLTNESWAKRFHAGWAAHNGVVAAMLAKEGFTGPATIFEGRCGLYNVYATPGERNLSLLTSHLGHTWEILNVSLKPYPCCHFSHAIIDAINHLKMREGISPNQVENITCYIPERTVPIIGEPLDAKRKPLNSYGAKFSLPFIASLALIEPEVTLESFNDQTRQRKDILELAQRVEYIVDPSLPFPQYFPAKVRIHLRNGKTLKKYWKINRGHPDLPLTQDFIIRKFKANAKNLFEDNKIQNMIDQVSSLEKIKARELAATLRK